jgi:hypothetical protein
MIYSPTFNGNGGIDCEVDHPEFGRIPFTARQDDPEAYGSAIFEAALAMGPAPYVPTDPEEILVICRALALEAVLARIEALTAQFTVGYPSAEIQSWPTKAAEAAIVLAGGSSAMIAAEAAGRGKTLQEMATKIAENAAFYTTIIGAMSGVRGSAGEAIAAAATPEEVEAALSVGLTAGQAAAANLGLEF